MIKVHSCDQHVNIAIDEVDLTEKINELSTAIDVAYHYFTLVTTRFRRIDNTLDTTPLDSIPTDYTVDNVKFVLDQLKNFRVLVSNNLARPYNEYAVVGPLRSFQTVLDTYSVLCIRISKVTTWFWRLRDKVSNMRDRRRIRAISDQKAPLPVIDADAEETNEEASEEETNELDEEDESYMDGSVFSPDY